MSFVEQRRTFTPVSHLRFPFAERAAELWRGMPKISHESRLIGLFYIAELTMTFRICRVSHGFG